MAFIPRIIDKFLDLANLKRHNDNYADIKTELDSHETDIVASNTHIANNSIHTTQAEKDKLAGIQVGAEVNQNAFSKITVAGQSDVDADTKTDTLTITGGTGITVSTDPATDTVIITATGTATPGPHAATHITGGADVIPNAVSNGNSGLMPGADKGKLDQVTTAELGRLAGVTSGVQAQVDSKAPIDSPAFTGTPTVPTAAQGDNSTQAASTAFVQSRFNDAYTQQALQGGWLANYQSGRYF